MSSHSKLAIIVDGTGFAYRSLYSKHDSDSQSPVAKKFIRYILNILAKYSPEYLVICFDGDRNNNYRRQLLPEYKANRDVRPQEITTGINKVKEFCDLFNIKHLEIEGQEADDIACSLSKKFTNKKVKHICATVDGDYAQLHSKYCRIAKPTRDNIVILNTWSDVKSGFKKIAIDNPEQVIELLGLTGDKSDGIKPPVPKVGIKRATELINKYGTIRRMFLSEDTLPYDIRKYEYEIFKTRNLVKMYDKIELPDIEHYKYNKFDYGKCMEWLKQEQLDTKLFNQVIDLDF